MRRYLGASCALACAALPASNASAAMTAQWVRNTITPAAIGADAQLANMQSWSLRVTNTDGHWASAGLRAQLPAGNVFYSTPATRGGADTHPNPTFFAIFPDLEFDTYVSSPRNQFGANPPAILGSFPENQPPQSFGGPTDPAPGLFSVAWGDPQATQGPGPGTYEIVRLTFPASVNPADIVSNINNVGQGGNWSRTSQVTPDQTIEIPDIPEPASLGLVAAAGLLALRRRK
jgi:hypothetical protein